MEKERNEAVDFQENIFDSAARLALIMLALAYLGCISMVFVAFSISCTN